MIQSEPFLEVGIVSGTRLSFRFDAPFTVTGELGQKKTCIGEFSAVLENGLIRFDDRLYSSIEFKPATNEPASFTLFDVRIGIGFHWERSEEQIFEGHLKLITEETTITAVNKIPLESYLVSVISSEMSARASLELLKTHAVISRSWLLAQISQKIKKQAKKTDFVDNDTERIRWYDREDHLNFDVCADDHCQRYQGITKASTPQVREAVLSTRGQVLFSGEEICDARFSKCCGGMLEEFQYCWEDTPKSYLKKVADIDVPENVPDLQNEERAREWIQSNPPAFCRTSDKKILQQVLNGYDQETTDFYRWTVSYHQDEINRLISERSGIDFGEIKELVPIERGTSGRIVRLKIIGSKKTMILGKELEIRKTLSRSHLYSSAFVVEKTANGFTLHGAGWGHGVGLCQIGAAVMSEKGYGYDAILQHYYPNTYLQTLYS